MTDRFAHLSRAALICAGIAWALSGSAGRADQAAVMTARSGARTIDFSALRAVAPPSAAAIQSVETRVMDSPATLVASRPASTPPPAAAERIATLEPGRNYHVTLAVADENTVVQQLSADTAIRAQGQQLVTLPGAFRQLASDGTEILLKPIIIPQTLVLDRAASLFVGSIKVGVSEIGAPAMAKRLSAPVPFQVLEGDLASPEEVDVDHSGLPMRKIRISSPQAAGGLTVNVASSFNPEGVPVTLRLAPVFQLGATRSIQGLGLEAATIIVSATGLPNPKGQVVDLIVDGPARPEADEVHLDANGHAVTKLRSFGVGSAVVTARLSDFADTHVRIDMALPVLTIVSSLVGGIIGGLIRLLPTYHRGRSKDFWAGLAVSVLVGFVVFGLYAVGVNVLPFQPTVEAGAVLVAVVSAIGAIQGAKVLTGRIDKTQT